MTPPAAAAPPRGSLRRLAISVALALVVGAIGAAATLPNLASWYDGLVKPVFNPPDGVFGPVWTVLYVLMAAAAWRVWERTAGAARVQTMVVYGVQLALNLAWPILFFGLHAPRAALAELGLLIVAVGVTAFAFWRRDRAAGLMLLPYLAWCDFAFMLNFWIWRLNR